MGTLTSGIAVVRYLGGIRSDPGRLGLPVLSPLGRGPGTWDSEGASLTVALNFLGER